MIIERYWYLLVVIAVGALAIWLVASASRNHGSGARRGLGWFAFGPFWPAVDRYLARRGGFTRREWVGWSVVLIVVIIAIVFTSVTGIGRR